MLGNGSQGFYYEMPGTNGNMGRLSAYRTADMAPLWSFQQRAPFLTGVVSTARAASPWSATMTAPSARWM